MILQYITILLSLALCVAVVAIVVLCGLADWMMGKSLDAENAVREARKEIRLLRNRLARKNFQENRAKEKAAGAANTDGKSK